VLARKAAMNRDVRLRVEITQLERRLSEPGRYDDPDAVRQEIAAMLNDAKESTDGEEAWTLVHEACRREIARLRPIHLAARITDLACELDAKVTGWRLKAAKAHLDSKPPLEPELVSAALALLHDKFDNDYRKIAMLRTRLRVLSVVLVVALVILGGVVWRLRPDEAGDYVVITSLGLVGGALSALQRITHADDGRIPQQIAGYFNLLTHPLAGAAAAVGTAVLLRVGIVKLSGDADQVVYGAAFLAGFSERWFVGLVETVGVKKGK
jgi:hypothetical protein